MFPGVDGSRTLPASTFPRLNICLHCETLFTTPSIAQQIFKIAGNNSSHKYQRSRFDFEKSAATGCIFCTHMLRPDLRVYEQGKEWQWTDLILGASRPFTYPSAQESLTCEVSFDLENAKLHLKRTGTAKRGATHFSRFVTTTADDPMAAHNVNILDIIDRRAPECHELALSWFQQCKSEHSACGPDPPNIMPSRLVEILFNGKSLSARICSTEHRKGNYLALSYCWGGPQEYAIVLDRVDEYHRQLPYQRLPATIQDAIQTTYNLGYRYIWVDALCIIQDSPADLNMELPRIKEIYQNADLTISVACAEACTEGFLSPRYNGFFRLPVHLNESTTGNILMNDQISTWARGRGASEPLNQRAWTLQESLLSKRLLIFPKRGIFYRCRAGCRADNMQSPDWSFWAGRFGYRRVSDESPIEELLLDPSDTERKTSLQTIRRGWFDLIESYTERQLTVANDKLVAVSALAESLSHLFDCDYLAGLWRSDLVPGLCWQSYRTTKVPGRASQRVRRPAHYLAPSWSWASIMGPVQYSEYQMTAVAEVLHAEVTASSIQVPFGAVIHGLLILKTWVREVELKDTGKAMVYATDPSCPELGYTYLTISMDVEHEDLPYTVLLLTLLTQTGASQEKRKSGLILLKILDSDTRYRRVGWFDNYNDIGPLAEDHWTMQEVGLV